MKFYAYDREKWEEVILEVKPSMDRKGRKNT